MTTDIEEKTEGTKTEAKKQKKISRAARFAEAISIVSDAKCQIEELKGELENWLDNLPENLQSSQKAETLQTAIYNLEEVIGNLEDVENVGVEFPGMCG